MMRIKPAVSALILAILGAGLATANVIVRKREAVVPNVAPQAPTDLPPGTVIPGSPAQLETKANRDRKTEGAAFHWSQLESTDYREFIANLKAAGCPTSTINDIIIAEFNTLYAARENPLKAQIADLHGKRTGDATVDVANTKREFALRKQLREVEAEKQARIKELTGVDIPLDPIRGWHPRTYDRYESALNTLPPNKRELVRQIQEEYWETSDLLNDKYQLRRTPEYLEEYQRINAERKARLAKALSPQEAADYEMRFSGIASRLGTDLSGIAVTPDEFREIFGLKNGNEAPFGGTVRVNETETGETPEHLLAKQQVQEKIAAILGPERYEAYQLAQDPNFRRFSDLGDKFGITRENLVQAYKVQQQFAPPGSPRLTGADREGYEASMRELLGDRAYEALQRGQNFNAINQLFFP